MWLKTQTYVKQELNCNVNL